MLTVLLVAIHPVGAEPYDVDDMEQLFGATNVNAMASNGGLAVGFSAQGEITVLRWPSPSYYDQVDYETSNDEEARSMPRFGAKENEGVFAGLWIERDGVGTMTWLRDAAVGQEYEDSGSPVVVTRYQASGADVSQRAFVDPNLDTLVLQYQVGDTSADAARLIFFENFAPCLTKVERTPTSDWISDSLNDHGAVYLAGDDAIVHFLPEGGEDDRFSWGWEDRTQDEVDAYADDFGDTRGVYLAIGASRASAGHQIGLDAEESDVCSPSVTWRPEDAWDDAQDGDLSGSPIAACQATGALAFDLDPAGDTLAVFVTAFEELGYARAQLDVAREDGADAIEAAAVPDALEWLATARLPSTDDSVVLSFSQRTLLAIHQGTDRHTGAIVASITTQPPYAEDWPRDSAFFNAALDVAGYTDAVTAHNRFLASVAAVAADGQTPAGAWYMNYYADGAIGGFIPFEIDETGLALWTLENHAAFIEDEAERAAYLEEVWPAIERGAELLAECRDDNGLQCPANEDDHPELTQTLHGAQTVWLGLRSASKASCALGKDAGQRERWDDRAGELLDAAIESFWDEDAGRFTGDPGWWLWPVAALPYDDERMLRHGEALFADADAVLHGETEGAGYVNKATNGLALLWQDDAENWSRNEELALILARDVPTSTQHQGEVFVTDDFDGDGQWEFENRVAIPHLWAATLTYLTLMAQYDPDAFDPFEATGEDLGGGSCPTSDDGGHAEIKGCGCGSTRAPMGPALFLAALVSTAYRRRSVPEMRYAAPPSV